MSAFRDLGFEICWFIVVYDVVVRRESGMEIGDLRFVAVCDVIVREIVIQD